MDEIPGLSQELLAMPKEELILELIRVRQEHAALKEETERCRKQLVQCTFRQFTAETERDSLKAELEKTKQALLQATQSKTRYS